jgi:hypothetical protein
VVPSARGGGTSRPAVGAGRCRIPFPPEHPDTVAVILRLRRKRRAESARLAKLRPKTLSGVTFSSRIRQIDLPVGSNPAGAELAPFC